MKWMIFETETEARAYSHEEAVRRGKGKDDDIIQYWWTVKKTAIGKWAVCCPEGTEEPEFEEQDEY